MSIRAYRVEYIKSNEKPTFNLGDEHISDWLSAHTDFYNYSDSTGIVNVSVEDLKKMVEEISDKLEKEIVISLKTDIYKAVKEGEEYITYLLA